MEDGPTDIAAMTFEDAMAELERIVQHLEQGRTPLEEAIAAYERGAALRRHCEDKLRQAQARIEKITLDDGAARAEPFDPKAGN